MEQEDDFAFVPPQEILKVERDTWYDSFQRHPDIAFYHVTYRGTGGLLFAVSTWASDELDAYNRVMGANLVAAPSLPVEVK